MQKICAALAVGVASGFQLSSVPSSSTLLSRRSHTPLNAETQEAPRKYRVAVVGGGPAGACAAEIFAENKDMVDVYLFERKMDNCKPCGGAIPLCMIDEFSLPREIVDREVTSMKMISPSGNEVDVGATLKDGEFIGMTRREILDKYLRDRAVEKGANAINGLVTKIDLPREKDGKYTIHYSDFGASGTKGRSGLPSSMDFDLIIGADGANSRVAEAVGAGTYNYAMAFQERIKIPDEKMKYYENLAEMYVGDDVSPDFYAWVFPKYDHVGVGTGTVANRPAIKKYQEGIRVRAAEKLGGDQGKVIRVEAHPIPEHYRPQRVVDRVALVGDAAGYVTKCSGEGIYFAAKSGRMAAQEICQLMKEKNRLPTQGEIEGTYLKKYDAAYGPTYFVLDLLQKVFFSSNAAREAFVALCGDAYVQKVTFDSYLYKKVQGNDPLSDIKLLLNTLSALAKGNSMAKPDEPFYNPVESKKRLGSNVATGKVPVMA
uniref:Geranylgeranyl diphosphate reductase, chloroplastic n=1 Tax=Chromera velia CCMP2878 TaxID=1169474 RepID=A0A0G4FV03_9ALVE|eukprot:Cvel_18786.t1-p1 / transcript=Cvel_18786.t1 / gene=Cvel_18786 / organism=Chromera_velia_CCMP2878 / gene_product=Geranylgeranyl diphosphate reductase, chloroplastic, putative / transcript_product=Geranylgeranyl diphosphate reductase, chloroplastic, putative / location=Cvel_scaffold1577:15828-19865(+) / protein_length=486 / sequence_SO=supercontig / SO=protein_coding / is_pseudo=false